MSQLEIRTRQLNTAQYEQGDVVYYPVRDLRVRDNYALLYARELAEQNNTTLRVVFVLYPEYIEARARQYKFMFEGLEEFEADLAALGIVFELRYGDDTEQIQKLIQEGIGAIVTDFSPLRRNQEWKQEYAPKCAVPLYEVDAHNVIPPWVTSPKQEFAAYTIRPKVYRLLDEYLIEIPEVQKQKPVSNIVPSTDWGEVRAKYGIGDEAGDEVKEIGLRGGAAPAEKVLHNFIVHRLPGYATGRNDPNQDAQSNLSPYITFGFISRTHIALAICSAVRKSATDIIDAHKNGSAGSESAAAFLEELIVRSELAENFCFYNNNYDNVLSFHEWSQKTHVKHAGDARDYIYTLAEFETATTHDTLWNAAQNQMLRTGKMHGFMRMYWAKKVFEWTESAEVAMSTLVYLNDTYSLDGRDPNGYAGIAWSVGGVHDRAWFERMVFGQIRYMNYNGCKRKFDVKAYENTWNPQETTQKELF
jgi:deoxyribodipyrimidine photo-lyase